VELIGFSELEENDLDWGFIMWLLNPTHKELLLDLNFQ